MTVNQQTLKGNWNEIKGKLRARWGEISGDQLESAHGNVDQLVGTIQRETGEKRGVIEQYLEELTADGASAAAQAAETVREYAQNAQESVQCTAKQASEAVRSGYEQAERTVQTRPVESLAVSFGAGLITGVVVGLMFRSR